MTQTGRLAVTGRSEGSEVKVLATLPRRSLPWERVQQNGEELMAFYLQGHGA